MKQPFQLNVPSFVVEIRSPDSFGPVSCKLEEHRIEIVDLDFEHSGNKLPVRVLGRPCSVLTYWANRLVICNFNSMK